MLRQTEEATRVLTGLPSWPARSLTNSPADVALVLTGGGLGGCRRVWGRAGATGDVRLTYSDRSISNWGTQEPTSQTKEPEEPARKARTEGSNYVTHGWTHTGWDHLKRLKKNRRNMGRTWRQQPNSVYISFQQEEFRSHIWCVSVKQLWAITQVSVIQKYYVMSE